EGGRDGTLICHYPFHPFTRAPSSAIRSYSILFGGLFRRKRPQKYFLTAPCQFVTVRLSLNKFRIRQYLPEVVLDKSSCWLIDKRGDMSVCAHECGQLILKKSTSGRSKNGQK